MLEPRAAHSLIANSAQSMYGGSNAPRSITSSSSSISNSTSLLRDQGKKVSRAHWRRPRAHTGGEGGRRSGPSCLEGGRSTHLATSNRVPMEDSLVRHFIALQLCERVLVSVGVAWVAWVGLGGSVGTKDAASGGRDSRAGGRHAVRARGGGMCPILFIFTPADDRSGAQRHPCPSVEASPAGRRSDARARPRPCLAQTLRREARSGPETASAGGPLGGKQSRGRVGCEKGAGGAEPRLGQKGIRVSAALSSPSERQSLPSLSTSTTSTSFLFISRFDKSVRWSSLPFFPDTSFLQPSKHTRSPLSAWRYPFLRPPLHPLSPSPPSLSFFKCSSSSRSSPVFSPPRPQYPPPTRSMASVRVVRTLAVR